MAKESVKPPKTTRQQRQASKQVSTAAIEFVRKQIDILKPFELSRTQRLETFQAMMQDDAVATCFAARTMAVAKAQAKGSFEYDENSEESKRLKDFLEYNMRNLSDYQSTLTIGMAASHMIRDGWSPFEMVFEDGTKDWEGFWKLKKLAYIHPLSLDKSKPWQVATGGERISYLRQLPQAFQGSNGVNSYSYTGWAGVKNIDFNRVCYSSYSSTSSQPMGQSAFEAAYIPWKEKQLLQDLTLIGVQKDLAGMPILGAPSQLLIAAEENPDGPEARMIEQMKDNLANLHAGDQAYSILPTDTHSDNGSGQKQFELKFQGIEGGGKNFEIAELVEQRRRAIFSAFACLNIISGENGGGSYNLLEGQSSIQAHFVELDNMVVDNMFNKQVFPLLLKLNGWEYKDSDLPVWKSGEIQPISIDEAGKYLQRVKIFLPAHSSVVNHVLKTAGINYRVEDDLSPDEIRELMFGFEDNSGEGDGSSGTGDSQSGGSSSDNNNENAS